MVGDDPRLRRMATSSTPWSTTPTARAAICCPSPEGHIFGVDHGVTFSTDPKLRTVLWGWMGTPFEADELEGLERVREALRGPLAPALAELLDPAEVTATKRRVASLLRFGRFPRPRPDWPAIPWPAF